jgi:hypothetical protein
LQRTLRCAGTLPAAEAVGDSFVFPVTTTFAFKRHGDSQVRSVSALLREQGNLGSALPCSCSSALCERSLGAPIKYCGPSGCLHRSGFTCRRNSPYVLRRHSHNHLSRGWGYTVLNAALLGQGTQWKPSSKNAARAFTVCKPEDEVRSPCMSL